MDVLVEIVKNLLVIIILAGFLELLLPTGSMKPYVRLTIGMFVLIAILSPLVRWLYPQEALQINAWEWSDHSAGQQQIMDKGSQLHNQILDYSNSEVQSKLEGQISAIALLVPGVSDADSKISLNSDGSIQKVTINVSGADTRDTNQSTVGVFPGEEDTSIDPAVEARMAEIMKNMFGLSEQQIEIQVKGGP